MGRFVHSSSCKKMARPCPPSSRKTMSRPCPPSSSKTMVRPCPPSSCKTMARSCATLSAQTMCGLRISLFSRHPPARFRPLFLPPLQAGAETVSPLFSENIYLLLKLTAAFPPIYNTNSVRPGISGGRFLPNPGFLLACDILFSTSSGRQCLC
jgi:hypothetical protein